MSEKKVSCVIKTHPKINSKFLEKIGVYQELINEFVTITEYNGEDDLLAYVKSFTKYHELSKRYGESLGHILRTMEYVCNYYNSHQKLPDRTNDKIQSEKETSKYQQLLDQTESFHQKRLQNEITLNERNELVYEFAKNFEIVLKYLLSNHPIINNYLTERQYKKLQNVYAKNKKLTGQWPNPQNKLSFRDFFKFANNKKIRFTIDDLVDITTRFMLMSFDEHYSYLQGDNITSDISHLNDLMTIVRDHALVFVEAAKPIIKQNLGIKLPRLKFKTEWVPIKTEIQDSQIDTPTDNSNATDAEDYDQLEMVTEDNVQDDGAEVSTSNETMISREHWTNVLTINLQKRLRSELKTLFRTFLVENDKITKWGSLNYFDADEVYHILIDTLYDCPNSQEMMRRLQNENFDAPFKQQLLQALSANPTLKTQLWKAIHTTKNLYVATDKSVARQVNSESMYQQVNTICVSLSKRPTNHLIDVVKTTRGFYPVKRKDSDVYETYYRSILNHIYNTLFINGVESSNEKLYTKKQKDGYVIYDPNTHKPVRPKLLYSTMNTITLEKLIRMNPELQTSPFWSSLSNILETHNPTFNKKNKELSIEEFVYTLLEELGCDFISSQKPSDITSRILYAYGNNQTMSLRNFKDFVSLFTHKKNRDLFDALPNNENVNNSTEFNKLLLKEVYKKINRTIPIDVTHTTQFDGKSFQTYTPINYVNQRIQELKRDENNESERQKKLATLKEDDFAGYFIKHQRRWFRSLEQLTYLNEVAPMSLATFLQANGFDWSEILQQGYLNAALTAYFKCNVGKTSYNGRCYLTPTLESKNTAYYGIAPAYRITDGENIRSSNYSLVSEHLTSVFMMELHRIKTVYEQTLAGIKTDLSPTLVDYNSSSYENNNNEDDVTELKRKIISFDKDLKGCTFHFLNEFRDVWENQRKNNPRKLSESEEKILKYCYRYIYTSQEFQDLDYFDLVDSNSAQEFEEFYNLVNEWIFDRLSQDARQIMQSHFNTPDDSFIETLLYGTNEDTSSELGQYVWAINTINTITALGETATEQQRKLLNDANVVYTSLRDKAERRFIEWYMNQYNFSAQYLMMFAGDVAIYKNVDNLCKRLPEISATGNAPDTTCTDPLLDGSPIVNKRVMVISDLTGKLTKDGGSNFIAEIVKKDMDARIAAQPHLSPEEKQKLYQQSIKKAQSIKSGYDKINGTDGQSLMSIEYLRKYLIQLADSSDAINAILKKLVEVYTCKDEDYPQILKEYRELLSNLDEPLDIATKKVVTYALLPTPTNDGNGNTIIQKKPTYIKTADTFSLDPSEFTYFDENGTPHKDENNLSYRLQKFMLNNNIDGLSTESSMKVFCPKTIDIDTRNRTVTEIIAELENAVSKTVVNDKGEENVVSNPDYVLTIPVVNNLHSVETHSDFLDLERITGIQFQKLIVEVLEDDQIYEIPLGNGKNEKLTGLQLYNKIDQLYKKLYDIAYTKLVTKFQELEKLPNEERQLQTNRYISDLLLDELDSVSDIVSQNTLDALKIVDGKFAIPLGTPSLYTILQKLIISIVKNELIGVDVPGGDFIQIANITNLSDILKKFQKDKFTKEEIAQITSDDLDVEYIYQNGKIVGIKSLEVALPFYLKDQVEKYINEYGYIDMEKVPEELKQIIGYRIPTEGLCSMFPIKVKRFLDPHAGGNIRVPFMLTQMSGSDFDIDKMFFLRRYFDEDGNYITPNETTKEGICNYLFECFLQILLHPASLAERMIPQGFPTVEKLAGCMGYIEHMAESDLSKTEMNKIADEIVEKDFDFDYKEVVDTRSPCNPIVQADLHDRNHIAGKAIGIAAVHRQCHAFFQHFGLKIKCPYQIIMNGQSPNIIEDAYGRWIPFDNKYCFDGVTKISDALKELIAAAVDAAKKPLFGQLNLNLYTFDIAFMLIRIGFTLEDTLLLLNQPIMRAYTTECERVAMTGNYVDKGVILNSLADGEFNPNFPFIFTTRELLDGILNHNSVDKRQSQLVPFFVWLNTLAEDCFNLNSMSRRDSLSGNNWSSMYEYITSMSKQLIFSDNTIRNKTTFHPQTIGIFTNTEPVNNISQNTLFPVPTTDDKNNNDVNYSRKLTTLNTHVSKFINSFMTIAGLPQTANTWISAMWQLSKETGYDRFKPQDVRNFISAYHTFVYFKARQNELENEGTTMERYQKYLMGDLKGENKEDAFITNFIKASAVLQSKYPTIFGKDGLVVNTPTKLREKDSVNKMRTINLYYRERPIEFGNNFMTEWESMFLDDSDIVAGYSVKQFAQELLDYCILKNGFDINNMSFSKYIPYNLTSQLINLGLKSKALQKTCKQYSDDLEENISLANLETSENMPQVIDLFIRHNRKFTKKYIGSELEQTPPRAKLNPGDIEIPNYFKNANGVLYKRNSPYSLEVHTLCYLGAQEIGVEYFPSKIDNTLNTDTATYFSKLNNWWIDRSGNNRNQQENNTVGRLKYVAEKYKDDILRFIITNTIDHPKTVETIRQECEKLGITNIKNVNFDQLDENDLKNMIGKLKKVTEFCKIK